MKYVNLTCISLIVIITIFIININIASWLDNIPCLAVFISSVINLLLIEMIKKENEFNFSYTLFIVILLSITIGGWYLYTKLIDSFTEMNLITFLIPVPITTYMIDVFYKTLKRRQNANKNK